MSSLLDRRLALGLLQRDLAAAAAVSPCALSYIERGKTWHCGPHALAKVEQTLKRLERLARKSDRQRRRSV